jgi:hypothetical protein
MCPKWLEGWMIEESRWIEEQMDSRVGGWINELMGEFIND